MSKRKDNRLGECSTTRRGESAVIVKYRNALDINVMFPDGYVLKHINYASFKNHSFRRRDYKEKRIGEQKTNPSGKKMTITKYRSSQDIEVTFDNGQVVQTSYSNFCKGLIADKSNRFSEKEDELILSNYRNNKKWLIQQLGRSESSIRTRYYRLKPSVKPQPHRGLLSQDRPDLFKEVIDKEKYADITSGSNQTIMWQSPCGHVWSGKVVQRLHGMNCPYCSHKRVLPGFNDFATINPELAKEWNTDKNIKKPSEVFPLTNIKVWWRCQ